LILQLFEWGYNFLTGSSSVWQKSPPLITSPTFWLKPDILYPTHWLCPDKDCLRATSNQWGFSTTVSLEVSFERKAEKTRESSYSSAHEVTHSQINHDQLNWWRISWYQIHQ
jgi:hypothetical protein